MSSCPLDPKCDEEGCADAGAWWHDKCAGVNAADSKGLPCGLNLSSLCTAPTRDQGAQGPGQRGGGPGQHGGGPGQRDGGARAG